ncbi:hypothetical protein A3K55_01205 [Candidatus Shapirobacteria bacterium RBG_13_44_7]|uniref:Uncharacterized protein n=1 Tax=Candidatus Shapirobacteria bacterium RBG_13_44_7 TaxID=1802149 RepID=A0A1F7SIW2_9BACT|nr:MAG: hypothetical protein A3K55_01205 [Candidatus Shapirobacteria bacterium RBG_13_44_7]
MIEKNKNLMIAGRFITGLSLIGAEEFVAVVLQHNSPLLPFLGMVMQPMLVIFFLPPLITAIYFMFSSQMKWRIDIVLLLISIACIIGSNSFNFGGN